MPTSTDFLGLGGIPESKASDLTFSSSRKELRRSASGHCYSHVGRGPDLWREIFTPQTYVAPYPKPNFDQRLVVSYPVATAYGFLQWAYQKAATLTGVEDGGDNPFYFLAVGTGISLPRWSAVDAGSDLERAARVAVERPEPAAAAAPDQSADGGRLAAC